MDKSSVIFNKSPEEGRKKRGGGATCGVDN